MNGKEEFRFENRLNKKNIKFRTLSKLKELGDNDEF